MICMAKYRARQMQRGRQRGRTPHRPNDDPNIFAGTLTILSLESQDRAIFLEVLASKLGRGGGNKHTK